MRKNARARASKKLVRNAASSLALIKASEMGPNSDEKWRLSATVSYLDAT